MRFDIVENSFLRHYLKKQGVQKLKSELIWHIKDKGTSVMPQRHRKLELSDVEVQRRRPSGRFFFRTELIPTIEY